MLGVTLQTMDYHPIHRGLEYSLSPPATETGDEQRLNEPLGS